MNSNDKNIEHELIMLRLEKALANAKKKLVNNNPNKEHRNIMNKMIDFALLLATSGRERKQLQIMKNYNIAGYVLNEEIYPIGNPNNDDVSEEFIDAALVATNEIAKIIEAFEARYCK